MQPCEYIQIRVDGGTLSRTEGDLIQAYVFEQQSQKGLADSTAVRLAKTVTRIAELLHGQGADLSGCTAQDLLKVVAHVRENGYSKNYQTDLISAMKRIAHWLHENGYPLAIEKIRNVKAPGMDWQAKKCEDLLTKAEVHELIEACKNSRDRAIVSVMYDGSNRPKELLELRWGDITFDAHGAFFKTSVKTGYVRHIRLTFSVPYLLAWKNDFPEKVTEDAHVFVQVKRPYTPLKWGGIYTVMKNLREETGNQKIKPSVFRPSRITHDLEDGYDQPYVLMKNWGNLKTNMIQVYAKVSDDYLDRHALEKAGLKEAPEKTETSPDDALEPRQCMSCYTINSPTDSFCRACGDPLTDEAREQLADKMQAIRAELESDPRFALLNEKFEEFKESLKREFSTM